MLLGKRQCPPMKRTTSLSEITFDLDGTGDAQPSDPRGRPVSPGYAPAAANGSDQTPAMPRAGPGRRHSADFLETPIFLRSCALCKRRLIPGRDIYMYRGDSAFCSLECRQQQINYDERKDKKCSIVSKKLDAVASSAAAAAAAKVPTTNGETVVAL